MRDRIVSCLAYYLTRPESVAKRKPWAVMHGMLPFGVEANVVAGTKQVKRDRLDVLQGKMPDSAFVFPRGIPLPCRLVGGSRTRGSVLGDVGSVYVPSSYAIQVEQKNYASSRLGRIRNAGRVRKGPN